MTKEVRVRVYREEFVREWAERELSESRRRKDSREKYLWAAFSFDAPARVHGGRPENSIRSLGEMNACRSCSHAYSSGWFTCQLCVCHSRVSLPGPRTLRSGDTNHGISAPKSFQMHRRAGLWTEFFAWLKPYKTSPCRVGLGSSRSPPPGSLPRLPNGHPLPAHPLTPLLTRYLRRRCPVQLLVSFSQGSKGMETTLEAREGGLDPCRECI